MSKQLVIPVVVAALLVSLADLVVFGHHHHDTNLDFSKVKSGNSASLQLNLAALTEELLQLDTENNVIYKKYADISLLEPPLVIFSTAANRNAAYNFPTIKTLRDLYHHFIANLATPERPTTGLKQAAIDNFVNSVLATPIMRRLDAFFTQNNIRNNNFTDIWFGTYSRKFNSRSGTNKGSCGFEHVFMAEYNPTGNAFKGFHNWLFLDREDSASQRRVDYVFPRNPISLGDKGTMVGLTQFNWMAPGDNMMRNKSISTMFIGASPEFEMAIYTLCFRVYRDVVCPIKLNNNEINIRTFKKQHQGLYYVSTAYPDVTP